MSQSAADLPDLIEQLQHKLSSKRRSAAKKLRKLKANEAGPAVLAALKNELEDKRTWETQYQMVMALGETNYTESLNFLIQLAKQDFEHTMVYLAIGDAVTNLEIGSEGIPISLMTWIDKDERKLVEGGLRALAMLHIILSDEEVRKIVEYVFLSRDSGVQFWAVAAAPGWPQDITKDFLEQAINSAQLVDTKKAAAAALSGKYLKWNPL